MNKRQFYKIQSEAFRDYANKFPEKENLLSLFNKWVISKDIFGVDRHRIWLKVREIRSKQTILIKENSEEQERINCVVDILHREDLIFLEGLINKKAKNK